MSIVRFYDGDKSIPIVRMPDVPEPMRTELLWIGFDKSAWLSEYMYRMLCYCRTHDSLRLKMLEHEILDECKKRHRHAWSSCFGGADHTVFGGGYSCYPDESFDKNFKYWITPILQSNMDDPDIRKMLVDIDTEIIQIEQQQKEAEYIKELERKELIAQQKRKGIFGLFG